MKKFSYKVWDYKSHKVQTGKSQAENKTELISSLKEKGLDPINIEEEKKSQLSLNFIKKKISLNEKNLFTHQLLVLLKAGVPLLSAVMTIKEQTDNPRFRDILTEIISDIEKGKFFSEALEEHKKVFGQIYVAMVKAAESGGAFVEVLERLVFLGDRQEEIRTEIKTATRYPIIVLAALVIVFFVLVTFVVPRFVKIFSGFDMALPLPTRILIGTQSLISSYWYLLIIFAGLVIYGLKVLVNRPIGRFWWDKIKISLPIFGPLILKVIVSRLARIIGMLTQTGIPIVKVLRIAKDNAGNCIVSKAVEDMEKSISQGGKISDAMSDSELFPPLVVKMIVVGEGTGKLEELLLFVSDYYDQQVKYLLKNLTTYIEPILIFILGCVVLFVALSVFLPMWNYIQVYNI